jgi:hypothetical protein
MIKEAPLTVVRHLLGIVVGAVVVFGLAAAYIEAFPLAFLPSGYPVWAAKMRMLDNCDLGAVMQFGDSQLEAGIVPHGLPLVATNFSAGGTSPMDSYFLVRQALACPNYPKHAILAFGVGDFLQIQEAFWANTVRFGIIGAPAIADIERTARRLHDPSFDDFITANGFSGWIRNLLYAHHFPPLYFSGLVRGGFFLRQSSNRALFATALAWRGQMPYSGVQEQPPAGRNSPPAPGFHPLPIQTAYFEHIVSALQKAGVSIDFIMMPQPQKTASGLLADNLQHDFVVYLHQIEIRHPNFHLIPSALPIWPDRYFVDEAHLNPHGASLFTAILNDCLRLTDQDWRSGTYARYCTFPSEPETKDVGQSTTR